MDIIIDDMPKTKDHNHIKQWLIPILDQRGMSIEDLSVDTGLSRAILYNYLIDRNRPSEQNMAKITHALKVPFEEGLRQYTPKKNGRPLGGASAPQPVRVHNFN